MYSDTVNGLVDRPPLELPEPVGAIVHLQEKLFVPVKEYPDVSANTPLIIAISACFFCSSVPLKRITAASHRLFFAPGSTPHPHVQRPCRECVCRVVATVTLGHLPHGNLRPEHMKGCVTSCRATFLFIIPAVCCEEMNGEEGVRGGGDPG